RGITIDADDNLYVTDYNTIRKVTPEGTVSTYCGNINKRVINDGDIKTASFHELNAIACDKNGTLYVTDQVFDSSDKTINYIIRKITPTQVSTIRHPDGKPLIAHYMYGLACDNNRNLLVSAGAWSSAIMKVSPDGIITTIAGIYDANSKNAARFKEGNLQSARLISPWGIAVNKNNEIFFSDNRLSRILKISNNQVAVIAGGGGKSATGFSIASGGGVGGQTDGKGLQAMLQSPHGITFDKDDNLFIVDGGSSNCYIRKLSVDGMVTTFCQQEFNPLTRQYETIVGEKKLVAENKDTPKEPKNEIVTASLQNQIDEITERARRMADSILQKSNTVPATGGGGSSLLPSLPSPDSARIKSIPKKILSVAELTSYLAAIHAKLLKLLPADAVNSAEAIEKKLGNDPNKMEATALIAWQKGAYEESVLLITSAAAKGSAGSILLTNAGSILDMTGLSEKAVTVLRTVVRIDPENAIALNNLGQAFTALGMQDSALHYFSRCLSLSPQHPEANNTAGYIELKKGNKDKAQAYFENSIRGSFNLRAYNGLLSIKKDYQVNRLIRPKVKIPEYFNELKYPLPRQCINVDIAAKCRQEHDDFKKMISDLREKNEALRKEAEDQFASQGVEKIKNNALQKKKVLRPFQLLGYVMGVELTYDYLKEKGELNKFDNDIKRQYKELEKQYQDERENLFSDYGGDGMCC
ncbi:MAG: tetratricopeptide repeat protein, partial [Flavisolibacter sp.]